MIFKIFSPKNLAKILAFLQVFAKIVIITLVFKKNAIFFAEDWQKSQKIVIITSTPDCSQVLQPLGPNSAKCESVHQQIPLPVYTFDKTFLPFRARFV
jgi:hypothetical protein